MPEHIVLSPYSFVGFEICNRLVEEGVEVTGVDLPVLSDPIEREEKELFLGRNSNFKLLKFEQLMSEGQEDYFYYISDLHCKEWLEYIEKIPLKKTDTIVYVVLDKNWLKNNQIPTRVNTTIILPTVYGPWQPVDTVFYQCLTQEQFPFEQYELEDKSDAIYSSDAAAAVLDISKLEQGVYQVQSDIKGHWHLLIKELGYQIIVDTERTGYNYSRQHDAKKYTSITKTSPQVGIDLVKKHIRFREFMRY